MPIGVAFPPPSAWGFFTRNIIKKLLFLVIVVWFLCSNLFTMFDCSEFADPVVAEATLEFLNLNKRKLLTSFPTLLPQV